MVRVWTDAIQLHLNHITNLLEPPAKRHPLLSCSLSRWFIFHIGNDWIVKKIHKWSLELYSVLGLLCMHVGSDQYDLCMFGPSTNPDSLYICVYYVCRSASHINYIGIQWIWSRNYESSNREKTHQIQFKSYRLCDVLVRIQIHPDNCYHGERNSFYRIFHVFHHQQWQTCFHLGLGVLHVDVSPSSRSTWRIWHRKGKLL